MPRNSFEKTIMPSNQRETILRYENPRRRYKEACSGAEIEFRDPSLVCAYFGYNLSKSPANDPMPTSFPTPHGDVRPLVLTLDITVAGCDPLGEENSDGGMFSLDLDMCRGVYVAVPASTLVAYVTYKPPAEEFEDSPQLYRELTVVGWAGLGTKASYNGAANASLTVYVDANGQGDYPPISIPKFARGIVAIADNVTDQATLTMSQLTGPTNGVVLAQTPLPITDGLAIPVMQGALSLQITPTPQEGTPTVGVRFLLAF